MNYPFRPTGSDIGPPIPKDFPFPKNMLAFGYHITRARE